MDGAARRSYYFDIEEKKEIGVVVVYKSKRTSIDRPCWRNDNIKMTVSKQYQIKVYRSYGNEFSLYDLLQLPKLEGEKKKFA